MKVAEILRRDTVHIPMSCTIREAARQMRDQHVGALVVTDGGEPARVVGFVTDRDIVLQAVALRDTPGGMLVADVMRPQVVNIDAETDLADAMQLMASHGLRRLAITDAAMHIVGVLSLDDVIAALSRDLGLLSSILQGELRRESTGCVQASLPTLGSLFEGVTLA